LSAINRYQSRNSGLVVDHARSLHIAASSEGFDFFTRSCPSHLQHLTKLRLYSGVF
jgi:hypothetical protein